MGEIVTPCAYMTTLLDAIADFGYHHSIQTVVISRFLINLRRLKTSLTIASRASQFTLSGFRVPTVPDFMGSMGQPLDHGWPEPEEGHLNEAGDELPSVGSSAAQHCGRIAIPENHLRTSIDEETSALDST